MYQFIFQGTEEQFSFFKWTVSTKMPEANLQLEHIFEDEFHCQMTNDRDTIFKIGMLLASCYSKFNHLKNTQFDDEQ